MALSNRLWLSNLSLCGSSTSIISMSFLLCSSSGSIISFACNIHFSISTLVSTLRTHGCDTFGMGPFFLKMLRTFVFMYLNAFFIGGLIRFIIAFINITITTMHAKCLISSLASRLQAFCICGYLDSHHILVL